MGMILNQAKKRKRSGLTKGEKNYTGLDEQRAASKSTNKPLAPSELSLTTPVPPEKTNLFDSDEVGERRRADLAAGQDILTDDEDLIVLRRPDEPLASREPCLDYPALSEEKPLDRWTASEGAEEQETAHLTNDQDLDAGFGENGVNSESFDQSMGVKEVGLATTTPSA